MKKYSMKSFLKSLVALTLCLCMGGSALADVLTLPAGVKVIEEEAFFGDTSLDEVVLPEGVEEIGPRAFGESSLRKINLPSSLEKESIAISALERDVMITAAKGTEAYEWALENGYTVVEERPEFSPEISDVYGQITKHKNYNEQLLYLEFKCKYLSYPNGTTEQAMENIKIYFGASVDQTDAQLLDNDNVSIGSSGYDYEIKSSKYLTGYIRSVYYLWIEVDNGIGQDSFGPYQIKVISRERAGEETLLFRKISDTTCSLDCIDDYASGRINGTYRIPSVDENGRRVVEISMGFSNQNFQKLLIPDSVQQIKGICYCEDLEEVAVPASVEYISRFAFEQTSNLKKIYCISNSYAWTWFTAKGFGDKLIEWDGITDPFISEEGISHPEWFEFSENGDGTCTLSNYVGPASSFQDIIIPAFADGQKVIRIGENAFAEESSLYGNLVIPDGIEYIESRAFYRCYGFRGELIIPDSVISIGKEAFSECSGFKELKLSANLQKIGEAAFAYLNSLEGDLIIPEGITKIENSTFTHCGGLYNISGRLILPEGLLEIGSQAFCWCGFAGNLVIPRSVTKIGSAAFISAKNFTGPLWIPDSVETLEQSAFAYCSGFSGQLKLPASLKIIEFNTFAECTGFTGSLIIPPGVTRIDNDAFLNCSGFNKNLYIPNQAWVMNAWGTSHFAFAGCDGLEYIYCNRENSAWNSFVEEGFENKLVNWDGDYSSIPGTAQLSGSFTNKPITLSLGDRITPSAIVNSCGKFIHRVTLTINDWNQDGTNNNRYRTRTFTDENLYTVSLTNPEWADEFVLDTTQPPLNVPGEYTINLWADLEEGSGVKLDSMTVNVVEGQFITFCEGSDFIGSGEEVTSLQENGEIVSRIGYPLTPGMELNIPFRTDADAQKVTVKLCYWNESEQEYYTYVANDVEIAASTTEFQTSGNEKTGMLKLTLPDGQHIQSGLYVLRLWSRNSDNTAVDARVEISIIQESTPSTETLSLSESTWILNTIFSEQKSITVSSDGDWTVVSESVPSWITVINTGGQNGDSFCLNCEANYDMARNASIIVSCGENTVCLEIIQPGKSDEIKINFASIVGLTLIGTPVNIQLSVKNADSVAVMTDGTVEGEPVSVRNGIQTISHIFKKGGEQNIVLIPYCNGVIGTPFNMGNITIREFGNLTAPELNYRQEMILGETEILSWPAVPNAETYAVIWELNGHSEGSRLLYAPTTKFELTPDIIAQVGTYSITVKAQAYGYNSSSSTAVITTGLPEINFAITRPEEGDAFIKGDLMDIQVSNPDRYHIAVKVTPENPNDPVIWLPADGNTCSDEMITETFYFQPTAAQVYTFEPMAWPSEKRGNEETAWRDSSRQVQITIEGPVFTNVAMNHSKAKVRLRSEISVLSVKTNNAVTSVSVYLDNASEPIETKEADEGFEQESEFVRKWEFELSAPDAGQYHTYKITASDGSKNVDTTIEFYCVADSDPDTVYSKANNQPVYRFPTGNQRDKISTINMMEEYELFGTYNEYSYIRCANCYGFVPSSMITDQIIYDTERIELGFVEEQSTGSQIVYTYVGAPQITIQWYSNKKSFNNNLIYRLSFQQQTRSDQEIKSTGSYTQFTGTSAKWTPSLPRTYKLLIELYDTVTNAIVKSALSSTTYVVYHDKQTYINNQTETERSIIEARADTFTTAANYFDIMNVHSTANDLRVKFYKLLELKLDLLAETDTTKAETIAEAIICSMAAEQSMLDTIPVEEVRIILEYMGVSSDIISCVLEAWAEINPRHINRVLRGRLEKNLKEFGKKLGYAVTIVTVAANLAESLINSIKVIDRFASIPEDQIIAIIQEYDQSDDPLLEAVARKLDTFRSQIGRISYAAGKLDWAFFQSAIEVGKTVSLDVIENAVGGSILLGISIGTFIGDQIFKTGDMAEISTKAKWAVEAINGYMPTFTTAKNNFIDRPTTANYQAFARSVMACQQLVINAYTNMIDFMKAVDDAWLYSADYHSVQNYALRFQTNCNYLIQSLDSYWSVWLSDDCEQVIIPTSNVFCP